MKKSLAIVLVLVLLFAMAGTAMAATGAPSGTHYSLNIIGVKNPKSAEMVDSSGHVIFVPLCGISKIELQEAPEGESFEVIDANATDGPAIFQLPDPGLDPYVVGDKGDADTISDYSVFVRPLGKPGGYSTITTCADLIESGLVEFLSADTIKILNRAGAFGGYASVEQVGQDITMRTKGKSSFTNVTAQLLTIVLNVEVTVGDVTTTELVRIPIFDDMLENEYWEYDNNNLKLLQVRFYPVGTDVSLADLYLPD